MTREQVEDRDRAYDIAFEIANSEYGPLYSCTLIEKAFAEIRAEERKRASGLVETLKFYDDVYPSEIGYRAREALAAYSASDGYETKMTLYVYMNKFNGELHVWNSGMCSLTWECLGEL